MVTRGNPVEINKLEKRYTWHDPDSNPDRSRGKPTLYQLRHGARNWNLNLCTFIYFWRLIASRNVRQCPGWNHETAIGWRSKMMRIFMMSRASSCWPYAIFFSRNKIEKKNFWPKRGEVLLAKGFFFFCGNQYIYMNLISICGRKKTNKSNTYNHKLFPCDQVISWMQALKSCPKKNISKERASLCEGRRSEKV